jgi:CRP-like cAMP-binding protein
MTIEDDIAHFESVPTLALLGREALRILAIGAENRYVHGGNVLFREGEAADGGYVIQEGSFSLAPERNNSIAPLAVGAGTLLGELALITETIRRVTATAREPSTVMRIPRSLFLKMLEGYPDAAQRLREDILRRAEDSSRDIHKVRGFLDAADVRQPPEN